MNLSAASPCLSSTSSTSSGSSKGIGTLHRVANTATRLARNSDFLWRRASRRISAQLRRSGMRTVLQPARQQRRELLQGLIAIGQQGLLTIALGQHRGETGDTEVLRPLEIGEGGFQFGGAVEGDGKLFPRQTGLLAHVH